MWGEIRKIFARETKTRNNGCILIVENNPADRQLFCRILEKEKYKPVVSQKESVLRMAEEMGPHLIILSSVISGEKSLDLCAKLKASAKTKAIPVLVLARKDDDSNIMEYYSNNADGYLMKPVARKEFISQVKSLINEKE